MGVSHLARRLGRWQLWAIAVGMVISGQYFGWNLGLVHSSLSAMLVALVFVTLFYCGFMRLYIDLAVMMPTTGGVMLYLQQAKSPHLAAVAGWAAFGEYFFAVVAIAVATGSYLHGLGVLGSTTQLALVVLILFSILNMVGLQQSARLELGATLLALLGIVLFIVLSWQPQPLHRVWLHLTTDYHSTLIAIPFVLWLYLGIEGSTLVAEEVIHPQHTLAWAIYAALITLVIGAVLTVLQVVSVLPAHLWGVNNPLPAALSQLYTVHSPWVQAVTLLGVFGLLASLNGLLLAASRQLFSLARASFAPQSLARLNQRNVPQLALGLILLLAILAVLFIRESVLLRLSILGVLCVYAGGIYAWFRLHYQQAMQLSWQSFCFACVITLMCLFCIGCVLLSFIR